MRRPGFARLFPLLVLALVAPAATPALAQVRTESNAFQGLPSTMLDVSLLGSGGKSVTVEARTNEHGTLPIGYVPWNEWTAGKAYDGSRIFLPDNAFGMARERGANVALSRNPFAIRNGQFVGIDQYALDVLGPFSLFCRSDEGPPRLLGEGDRFAFEVPGGKTELDWVLGQPYVIDPHVFPLPGGGHGVSSFGGVSPQEVWKALQALAKAVRIGQLEVDPCWAWLPNGRAQGCAPGVRQFPDKAFRLSTSVEAELRDRYRQSPINDAWVLFQPASPTPLFDPGERAGDEQPPTFVRSDRAGAYRATLDNLGGAVEIGVAKGCSEHTTLAIAEGLATPNPTIGELLAGTQARSQAPPALAKAPAGTALSPAQTSATSVPREKPAPDQRICGPDVTDHVLGVLQLIEDTYKSWDAATQAKRCGDLYGLGFNAAWDMQGFTPSDGEPTMPHIFFQRAAPGYCAVPRWPCGTTVQFFGRCIHAQVVNYLQWGMMNALCDSELWGIGAHWLRSTLFGGNHAGQDAMSHLGHFYGSLSSGMAERKSRLKHLLEIKVEKDRATWDQMEGADCALACDKLAPEAKRWLDHSAPWGFQWGVGFPDAEPVVTRAGALKKP